MTTTSKVRGFQDARVEKDKIKEWKTRRLPRS